MVLLRKWRVIFAFYCLVFYCVILVCGVCLYFVFIIIFVTEVFERLSGEDCLQLFRFIIVLALQIHCICSHLKGRGDYVKTSCPPCFSMEYTWKVCRDLLTLTNNLFSSGQCIQCAFIFFFHALISFNLLLVIAVSIYFCKTFDPYKL